MCVWGHFGGGFKGSGIEKCGKAAKRLDRSAPNLAHLCGFIWECTLGNKIITGDPRGNFGEFMW